MDKDLILQNKKIREKRPLTSDSKKYSMYENNGVLQICFKSIGCRYYLNGFCIMCDYGKGVNITKKELESSFDEAISKSKEPIKILLLNTYGSILDSDEIKDDCFLSLLNKISETDIKNIIFETHYTTICKEKLSTIKNILKDKRISFELGLESANKETRKNCLLKNIDNELFLEKIKLIHSFNMNAIANILVGIPFLNTKEQLNDSLNSIIWCFENGIDEVDLFPINIKPYTLLEKLYKDKKYNVISHWLLIELLNKVPSKYLSQIYLAWYGNRELEYTNCEHSIFPDSCSICHDDIMNFYKSFLSNNNTNYRKNLLNELLTNKKCNCDLKK